MSNMFLQQSAASGNASCSLTGVIGGDDDMLVAAVIWAGAPGPAPTDNHGNTYLPATAAFNIQPMSPEMLNPYIQLFYATPIASGNTTVLFQNDQSIMGTFLLELLDGDATFLKGVGLAGLGNANPFITPNVAANPGDFLVAFGICNGTSLLPSSDSGFTQAQSLTYPRASIATQSVTGSGPYQGTFTATNIDSYAIVMAQFN